PDRSTESLCGARGSSLLVCPCALAADLLAIKERRAHAPASSVPGRLAACPGTCGPRSYRRRPAGSARCRPAAVHRHGSRGAVRSTLMRILLLAQFFPPDIGGEERHVFNLAKALADRGHEVAVATQRMAGVPDRETLASGVRVHRFAT